MNAQNVLDDEGEAIAPGSKQTQADLAFLEALQLAKKGFFDDITQASEDQDEYFLATLRQEPIYQMAEFFFLLAGFGVSDAQSIRRYVELHNAHLNGLLEDRAKLHRLGLRKDRVQRAIFSEENINKVVDNYVSAPPMFDQSDLARFLTVLMSQETCRSAAVNLAKAGLLTRSKNPYGAVLVRSRGQLEEIFGRHLRGLREAVTELADAGGRSETGDKP